MSSFIGHGLAALIIGTALEKNTTFRQKLIWRTGLVLCAFAPDIDYLFPALNSVNNDGLRITHSVVFSLILPVFLMFLLFFFDRKNVFRRGLQACLAGLSHLFLDLLVGSRQGDPFFYPLFNEKIYLPFGVLPSAGAMRLSNFYFYRNSLIEIGILIPVFILIMFFMGKLKINKLTGAGLICMFVTFLIWSINLNR